MGNELELREGKSEGTSSESCLPLSSESRSIDRPPDFARELTCMSIIA